MWDLPQPWGFKKYVCATQYHPGYVRAKPVTTFGEKNVIFVFKCVDPTYMPKMIKIQNFQRSNLGYSTDYIQGPTKAPFQSSGPPTIPHKGY